MKLKRLSLIQQCSYGYRRVTYALRKKEKVINHKKVLRLMINDGILCKKLHRKSRSYYSFKGEVGKIADNILNRNFHINKPNEVLVSDVTEFKIHDSNMKLYLSPIMDLYNSEIISYSLSPSPTVDFTNRSLKKALKRLSINHKLMIHTDQGFHYQHRSWVKTLKKHKITKIMSRRKNCLNNSSMENFFGLLKQEMYYGIKYTSATELNEAIKKYID